MSVFQRVNRQNIVSLNIFEAIKLSNIADPDRRHCGPRPAISYIYLMTNHYNNVLYIGVTNNIIRKVVEHKAKIRGTLGKCGFDYAQPPEYRNRRLLSKTRLSNLHPSKTNKKRVVYAVSFNMNMIEPAFLTTLPGGIPPRREIYLPVFSTCEPTKHSKMQFLTYLRWDVKNFLMVAEAASCRPCNRKNNNPKN